jgi:hypothetical protein
MISSILNGGLGNQMFQIAAACSLAWGNNDVAAFYFGNKVVKQGNSAYLYRDNILSKVNELPHVWVTGNMFTQDGNGYRTIPYVKDMMLRGYFQSEKYFKENKTEILHLFINQKLIRELFKRYDFRDTVSIHVRRGDYLGESDCRALPLGYYERALSIFDAKKILVFSDDMDWCRENLEDSRMIFITGNPDWMDLYLMSLCKDNIIANSSFSWWASYLNLNKKKRIIAPAQWSRELKTMDMYTNEMTIL